MAYKFSIVSHPINSVNIDQRVSDGFINGTAMCVAHGRDISDWLKTDETWELVAALADDLGIKPKNHKSGNSIYKRVSATYPTLAVVKRGAPDTGGGTWLHPDLALQLAQWCNKPFAIQVSRWVREWMISTQNSVTTGELERLEYRDNLKDEARKRLVGQVARHLKAIQRYSSNSPECKAYFRQVHHEINIAITGESAREMRLRLSNVLGREVKDYELIRDFYPAIPLQRFIAISEAVANLIRMGTAPEDAVKRAAAIVLPAGYRPTPIDFTDHIRLVRQKTAIVVKHHSAS